MPPDNHAAFEHQEHNGQQEESHVRIVFGRETTAGGSPKARIIIEEATGNTSLSSVFTLSNSAIGAGVLSLPFAFYKAGALPTGSQSVQPCQSLWLSLSRICSHAKMQGLSIFD